MLSLYTLRSLHSFAPPPWDHRNDSGGRSHTRLDKRDAPPTGTRAFPPVSPYCTLLEVRVDGASHIIQGSGIPHVIHLTRLRELMKKTIAHAKKNFSNSFYIFIDTADSSSCKDSSTRGYSHNPRYFETLQQDTPLVFPFAITGNVFQPLAELSFPLPLHRYHQNMEQIMRVSDAIEYDQKLAKAVWHGAKSGYLAWSKVFAPNMTRTPRDQIVRIGRENPGLLEASYERHPTTYFHNFKYVVTVSGNSWGNLLTEALWSNSVVLRQDPVMYSWYEGMLVPWTHYIPVAHDLSDLVARIQWAKTHTRECKQMSQAARAFVKKHFNLAAELEYTYNVIEHKMPALVQLSGTLLSSKNRSSIV